MITDSFDAESAELITPAGMVQPVSGFPETMIVTFQPATFQVLVDTYHPTPMMYLPLEEIQPGTMTGRVHTMMWNGSRLGAYLSPIGAPMTVATMEIAIALGTRRFIVFGSCGTLSPDIAQMGVIVPTRAYRDEGTSYHYAPSSDDIEITTAGKLTQILARAGIPHTEGPVWTTDAFFRETRTNLDKRVSQGCIAVDMETSAVAALAQFRGVEAYHFLYAADSLGPTWNKGILGTLAAEPRARFVRIALEVAKLLD